MGLLNERIKDMRTKRGLTLAEVAEYLGVKEATAQRYESGTIKNIKHETIISLSELFHCSPEYLMGWDPAAAENLGIEPYRPTKFMPVLGRVAAGLPMCADENVEGYVANDYRDEYDYFALRVRGDSMDAAGVDDGDIVVVRQQDVVEDGDMAVVLVNGYDATVKYWHKEGRMVMLSPKSHNPDHKLQVYDCKDVPIKVLGRVVQIRKEV